MSASEWQSILPTHETIIKMPASQLATVSQASKHYVSVLAHGISGIGNILACTASNSETGLSESAVTDIGWMLENLGNLISSLSDIGNATELHLNKLKPGP